MRSPHHRRRLAAVMFTDLAGFSAMTRADEARALRLLQAHFRRVRAQLRRYGGQEIKTVGDAFLVRFGSALAALACAVAIQQEQAALDARAPDPERLRIRIGIHLGDVEARGGDLFGDGVNLAARVQGLASPGGIAISGAVRAQVHSELGRAFLPLGPQSLKNIPEPVEVFRLDGEALSQAVLPASLVAPAGRLRGRWIAAALGLLVLVVLAIGAWHLASPPKERSLAVLPLQSLSDDPADAYFAQGMQDELLGRLAQVAALRVLSRGSTEGLSPTPGDYAALARRLGVRYLLEGSVQKAGERRRVRLRLVDASSGEPLWAESYDRRGEDLLAVQSEIAAAVAEALSLRLTPAEQASLAQQPTASAEAYDAYLRGLALINQASPTSDDRAAAEQQFARATRLDPQFALAWAWWSRSVALRYVYNEDRSAEARRRAREALERARQLQPQLDQTLMAQGYYEYWVEQRYDAARTAFEQLQRRWPNHAEPPYALALIARRTGRWQDALRQFETSVRLDPRSAPVLTEWGLTLMGMRRFAEARARFGEARAVTPGDPQLIGREASAWLAEGRLAEAEALLSRAPDQGWDYVGAARFTLWQYQRRHAELATALQGIVAGLDAEDRIGRASSQVFLGWTLRYAGRDEEARRQFVEARELAAALVREEPENQSAWQALATAEAGLGHAAAADEASARSVALMVAAGDDYWAPVMEEFQARTEASLGEAAPACARLVHLLTLDYGEWPLTATDLRLSPDWDRLRDQDCFRRALEAAGSGTAARG